MFFLLPFYGAKAQLVVTTGQTAQQLAELIAGAGVTVSNATITGSPDAIGAFTTGANATGLGINSGVGLSNGLLIEASLDETSFASTDLGTPGSVFLDNLTGENSGDAIILEFDFVPNADFVEFKYVFCSEEHPTFSCSSYVDPFAITVEGVSVPLVETNIALVPGTNTPIQINSINDQGCGNPAYYVNNTGNPYLVYGGITTVMTASVNVICGETYRLRFLQSDGGFDQSFDTSCFIEENSLTTGNVSIQTSSLGGDTAAIEGCADLEIQLTLNGDPPTQDVPVKVWIGGGSTALWGVDYNAIVALNQNDSTVIIPAGSNSVAFDVNPINDSISEGLEYIDLVAITSTCGNIDTFRLYITEVDPLFVTAIGDTTICDGNAVGSAIAFGGGGGYTFSWNNGFGEVDTIYPEPTESTVYTVTVEDNCNSISATDSILVTVDDGPDPFAGNDVFVCDGASVFLNATSDTPGSTFAWSPTTDLSDSTIFNPLATPQEDVEYIVTVTRPDGCSNDDTVLVTVTPPPTAEFDLHQVGCASEPLIVEYTGNASPAAQFLWDFDGGIVTNGSGGGPIATYWETPGVYDVVLTVSWNGCLSGSDTNQIEIIGPPSVDAGSDISFCSGDTGQIGVAPVAGLSYSWSPIDGVVDPDSSTSSVSLSNQSQSVEVNELVLTAIDQGCKNYDTLLVTVFPIPTAEFLIPDGKCFNVNSFDLTATGFFSSNATFDWDFGPVGYPSGSTDIQPQGVIFNEPGPQDVTLTITDNNCVSNPFVGTIQVYPMPVADFTIDVSNGCEPLLVGFEDQSDNVGTTLYYNWDLGNGTLSNSSAPTATYSEGVYSASLEVVTGNGCANSTSQSNIIEAFLKPDALFSLENDRLSIIDPVVAVTNRADSVISSEFTFHPFGISIEAMQTEFEYPDTGSYSISQIVTTSNGCKDTISATVDVEPFYTFYIPNAFTPNDNRTNEIWVPQGESIKSFEMTIYNRWNQEIFYSASLNTGWDGTFKGRSVQNGIYTYSILVIDILGEPHVYRGTFSLIR